MKFVKLDITKKAILAFSSIFGDISVPVYNNVGEIVETEVVPIVWGSRNKTYEVLNSKYLKWDLNPDNKVELAQKLPVLSVSDLALSQDPSRQRVKTHRMTVFGNDSFIPAPMNLSFSLNLRTKTQDDLFCVIEQIIPYFTPSINVNLKTTNQDDFSESIQYNLDGVSTTIPTDVDPVDVVYYEASLSFNCKLHYYRLPLISTVEEIGKSGTKKVLIDTIDLTIEVELDEV